MTTKKDGQHTGRTITWPERRTSIKLAQVIGAGGEAEVYAVKGDPTLAVKIYHDHRRPQGPMAQKLSTMEAITLDFSKAPPTTLPRVAWPQKIIKLAQDEQVIGMVMPMVDHTKTAPISNFFNPTQRKQSLPNHKLKEKDFEHLKIPIAMNIITAVKAIHKANCVIGDVNDENILIDPRTGEASIVDCDAFQVIDQRNRTIHRCKVGREQFTAPELLRQLSQPQCTATMCIRAKDGPHRPDYSCLDRKPEHDMFGIGVILFKLFMEGAHPYNQIADPSKSSNTTLKDFIQSGQYPYHQLGPSDRVPPANKKRYAYVPSQFKDLFLRTFA